MNCPKCEQPLELLEMRGKMWRVCLHCWGYEAEVSEEAADG